MALFGSWLDDLLNGNSQSSGIAPVSVTPAVTLGSAPAAAAPPAPAPDQTAAPTPAPTDPFAALAQFQKKYAAPTGWQRALGVFGGGLRDFAAVQSGHPESANFMTAYTTGVKQREAAQLGLNAQNATLTSLGGADPTKALPADVPLQMARLAALGVDVGPIKDYLATRTAMLPKYTRDDYGNTWSEVPGQPPQIVAHGPGKQQVRQPGQGLDTINPYGFDADPAASAPPNADAQAAPADASAPANAPPLLPTGDQVAALITQQYPGAKVKSSLRTPEQNAAVNGVANSAHLQDTPTEWARDFHVPDGTDPHAMAAAINGQGIAGLKALYEGPGANHSTAPHLHVQYIAPAGGQAPAAAKPAPSGSGVDSNTVRSLIPATQVNRPPTAAELAQYPGASWIDSATGKPGYAPVGSVPIDANDPGIRAAGAALAEGKGMAAGRDQQSMRAIRNSAVVYLQNKFPGLTPEQAGAKIVQNEQDYNSGNAALKAWSSGKQSQTLDSVNNVFGHLQAYKQLADALKSGDVRLINAAKNAAGTAFGQSGPMELQEVTQILGPEMEKVVAGAGGTSTGTERAGWEKSFSAANSPAQASGVVNTALGLLGRRLQTANLAYKNSTHRDDFTDRLLPDVANFYQTVKTAAPGPQRPDVNNLPRTPVRIKGDADFAKLKSGTQFIGPDGKTRVKP